MRSGSGKQSCSVVYTACCILRMLLLLSVASRTRALSSSSSSSANTDALVVFQNTASQQPKQRDLSELFTWALERGVHFSNEISLQRKTDNDQDDWGVLLKRRRRNQQRTITTNHKNDDDDDESAEVVVLQVPKTLVWNAHAIYKEFIVSSSQEHVDAVLDRLIATGKQGVSTKQQQDSRPEFLLFVKLLQVIHHENHKNDSSSSSQTKLDDWKPWIESLPKDFYTGICMTDDEKECLPTWSRVLAEVHCIHFLRFCQSKQSLVSSFGKEDATTNDHDDELLRLHQWAFNVVYSRCWRFQEEDTDRSMTILKATDIVPIGDMFNHRSNANVLVQNEPDSLTVDFVYKTTIDDTDELYLSYGEPTNPHRFLVLFGFVDDTMVECDCEMVFPNPSKELRELGCNDRSKMVFLVENGAISNTVYDTVLYALLESQPNERDAFYNAHRQDDKAVIEAMHRRYRVQVATVIWNHVTGKVKELELLEDRIEVLRGKNGGDTPNLAVIARQNRFLKGVFMRVKHRLNESMTTT